MNDSNNSNNNNNNNTHNMNIHIHIHIFNYKYNIILWRAGVAEVAVVTEDGSPHGPKSFLMWNPPLSSGPAPQVAAADGLAPPRLPQMSHTEGRTRAGSVKWAAPLFLSSCTAALLSLANCLCWSSCS